MGKMEGQRKGVHKDYLEGLDNLRNMVTDVENELDKAKQEFYGCEENDEEAYAENLKSYNDKLLYCNNMLRKNGVHLQVIDSELKLVELLNDIRGVDDNVHPEIISDLTEYWEQVKDTMENLRKIKTKFDKVVLKRLTSNCISYHEGVKLDLTKNFHASVKRYQDDINTILKKFDGLARSFEKGIRQDQFTNSSFLDKVLLVCDQKAFPILRFVPDLSEKLTKACRLARHWIDKDETYVHDINKHIRETRSKTRKKEAALQNKKQKQVEMMKSAEEAYDIFKTNKTKLRQIEEELKTLDSQVSEISVTKKYKMDDKKQKEGMVGFLDISISQTRKNYSLQLKRSRLMRQLRDLAGELKVIEDQLSLVQEDFKVKYAEKVSQAKIVEESDSSHRTLKTDLQQFSENISKLQQEVLNLSECLVDLETIQTFKTSPEVVDDLYDRPAAVKLAPSLQEKIMRKRKFLSNGSQ